MAKSNESETHVVLFPAAGMGHITPFLRLAKSLVQRNCRVSLITTNPTFSRAESQFISNFLSAFPQVTELQFQLLPFDPTSANSDDPFFLQFESIRRSSTLLSPLLASVSPPPSALISDVTLLSPTTLIAKTLHLPVYTLFTSSARMFCLFSFFPTLSEPQRSAIAANVIDSLEIPGIPSIPSSSLPPPLLIPNSLFGQILITDGQNVVQSSGVLINSFEGLEEETISALNNGEVRNGLPSVFPIGPLTPCEFEKKEADETTKWLDDQPADSVVYVSFGSRTAMSREQIREVAKGLISSGYKFLWVVKEKKVDKEEEEEGVEIVIGNELMERVKESGIVVKRWVDQWEILAHKAVGGFVSHCGWNSVVEATYNGVPILAWPQHGDQKLNAEVVEKKGIGMWVRSWGWGWKNLVKGEQIGERIKEMMGSEKIREEACLIKEEARKACGVGGSCDKNFEGLFEKWRSNGGI